MSRRRKKKHRSQEEVELNLAAMLDMAFQLLTFFILTFRPAPVESQISMRMPPPIPVTQQSGSEIGSDDKSTDPLAGLKRLTVTITSTKQGEIDQIVIENQRMKDQATTDLRLVALDKRLNEIFKETPSEEMVVQYGSALRYEFVTRVLEVCSFQTLKSGQKLAKVTFAEFPDGSLEDAPAAKANK
jgi:biopolymer transport protein ExbD